MKRGVVYVATGSRFVNEALQSAASLKHHMPDLPIALFSDQPVTSENIDSVIRIDHPCHGLKDKILHIPSTPFEETLFLDTDTYVCGHLGELFALLDRFDIAAAHGAFRAVIEVDGVPECFPELNTGVILFRRTQPVEEMFTRWLTIHETLSAAPTLRWVNSIDPGMMEKGGLSDQPAFRKAVYESRLRLAILPSEYHCRLAFPGAVHTPVRILHGRSRDYASLERRLNGKSYPRCFWLSHGSIQIRGWPPSGTTIVSRLQSCFRTGGIRYICRRLLEELRLR